MAALLRGAHARLHLVRVGPASALAGSAAAGRAVAGASGGGGGLVRFAVLVVVLSKFFSSSFLSFFLFFFFFLRWQRNLATAATAASYLSKEEVLKDKFNDSNYLTSEQFYYLPNRYVWHSVRFVFLNDWPLALGLLPTSRPTPSSTMSNGS